MQDAAVRQERKVIEVKFQALGGGRYLIIIDGKTRYNGMSFSKEEALERVEWLGRTCDVRLDESGLSSGVNRVSRRAGVANGVRNTDGGHIMSSKSKSNTNGKSTSKDSNGQAAHKYAAVFNKEHKEAFLSQVKKGKPDECWLWQGGASSNPRSGGFYPEGKELRVAKAAYLIEHPDADLEGRYTATCGSGFCCNALSHIVPAGQASEAKASQPEANKKEVGKKSAVATKAQGTDPAPKPAGKAKAAGNAKKGVKSTKEVGASGIAFPKPGQAAKAKVAQTPAVSELRKPADKTGAQRKAASRKR